MPAWIGSDGTAIMPSWQQSSENASQQHCLSVPSARFGLMALPALWGRVRSSQQREYMCAIIINIGFKHLLWLRCRLLNVSAAAI